MELIERIIIAHTNLSEYLRLKALGYVTIWTGEGKICLGKYKANKLGD